MGHSRKHPYHPHEGNRKLTPYPIGCPNTFTIIRNNFSPLPLRMAEISYKELQVSKVGGNCSYIGVNI
jgi:hypothetical protein